MTQGLIVLAALSLAAGLIVIALLILWARQRRSGARSRAVNIPSAEALASHPPSEIRQACIVEQSTALERMTRKQLKDIMVAMGQARGWQSLGKQFDTLLDDRLRHLRVLAARCDAMLPPDQAMRHTFEAYRLSSLMLALHEELVAKSAVVTQILDDWFKASQGVTTAQFEALVHLDCARILLLNLDYASPGSEIALTQLNLAEEHCRAAMQPDEADSSAPQILLAEINLRKARLK